MSAREEILDALLRERYGKSMWWKKPVKGAPPEPVTPPGCDDSEATTARRRRELARDFAMGVTEESA